MFSLLKIKVSGFRMLSDNFEIDFLTKARVNPQDELSENLDSINEVFEIDENLYTFNMFAFTGKNASGKTTTLVLIDKINRLLKSGRWVYQSRDFKNDKIEIYIEFYLDGVIYRYSSDIMKPDLENNIDIRMPFCKILNEKLSFAEYDKIVGKRYNSELKFVDDDASSGLDDTSKLYFLTKDHFTGYYIEPFSKGGDYVSESFFKSLSLFNEDLTNSIIRLLDDSIEYMRCDERGLVHFKRFGQVEIVGNKAYIIGFLSNGTVKGIELYIRLIYLIKYGGMLIIDEIENCFHKNLVNNMLFLLLDKSLNKKNSQILFSTHYIEILDIFERRDNIFILHKKEQIRISNMYVDYGIRSELLKSKQFNNNTFDTLLNYDRLMDVKKYLKYEISSND